MSTRPVVVSGPIEGGRGRPFGSPSARTLAKHGYVMAEYILSGTAGSYAPLPGTTPGLDGHWAVQAGPEAAYTTRMYVVRPADPAAFNGVVVVNWQNVTAGVDLGLPIAEIYRGYAWVGVTTQRIGVEGQPAAGSAFTATTGLTAWDPVRYGTLSHPGDAWSYDIFTQAARTVAPARTRPAGDPDQSSRGDQPSRDSRPGRIDPLGGLVPRTIIAMGGSQSAMRLGSYLNLAHPHERLFDAFLLTVHWGMCPPPPDQPLPASFAPRGGGLTAGSARIRDDNGVPVLVLCSETETLNNYPVRQPDTATFRFWEMPGTAHASGAGFDALVSGVEGMSLLGAPAGLNRNEVSWDVVTDAALRHVVAWAERGSPPPSFPPLEVDPGPPAAIRRDAWGNALGGLRLPHVAAATGTHRGTNTVSPGAALLGETVPFTPAQLAERYPDRASYLAAYDGALDALVSAGLDLTPDLDALRAHGRATADTRFAAP